MITLTAKINLLSGDNNALSFGANNLSGNNISGDLELIRGKKQVGSNPFIIGASKLGDGSTFSNGENYFIGDQLSDDNGNFATPYEITINGNDINSLTIAFDTTNNRHPKFINIKEEPAIQKEELTMIKKSGTSIFERFECKLNKEIENSSSIKINTIKDANGNFLSKEDIKNEVEYSYSVETASEIYFNLYIYKYESYPLTSDTIYVEIEYNEGRELVSTEYKDDDAIFTITNLNKSKEVIIEINNWNAPKYPLVITGIYAEVSIEINRKNLIAINRSIFDRSDLKLPSWGIISNTGSIEFNDTDGEIRDYAEQLLLESGLKCEMFLNNTIANAQERIGLFETDEWDYDNDNRVVSVSLKDDLEEWQEILLDKIPLQNEMSMKEIVYLLQSKTPKKWEFAQLNQKTENLLSAINCKYPYFNQNSLWASWNILCETCGLYIFKNNDNKIVINSEFEA